MNPVVKSLVFFTVCVSFSALSYASGTSTQQMERNNRPVDQAAPNQPDQTAPNQPDQTAPNQPDQTTPNQPDQTTSSQPNQTTISLYDQGVKASDAGDFQDALTLFQQALEADPNNPDILNMLAHTQRKLGMLDEALSNYKKALELRPKFPEAREYLGETYIDAAMAQAETLKSYGSDGQEQLEDLSKAFKEAAEKL